MNYSFQVTILSLLGIVIALVPMDLTKVELVFAQSGGNSLGQEGDNEAS